MVILIFIYAEIGFFYLWDTYLNDEVTSTNSIRKKENFCQSMLECFLTHANQGLRGSGGIGTFTDPIPYAQKEE